MAGETAKTPQKLPPATDYRGLFTITKTRRTKLFAYFFFISFVCFTAFVAFNPSGNGSPWFNSLFTSSSFSSSIAPYRSHINNLISHIFPNSSSSSSPQHSLAAGPLGSHKDAAFPPPPPSNATSVKKDGSFGDKSTGGGGSEGNNTGKVASLEGNGPLGSHKAAAFPPSPPSNATSVKKDGSFGDKSTGGGGSERNNTGKVASLEGNGPLESHKAAVFPPSPPSNATSVKKDGSFRDKSTGGGGSERNNTGKVASLKGNGVSANVTKELKAGSHAKASPLKVESKNQTLALTGNPASSNFSQTYSVKKTGDWIEGMLGCDIFHGKWVKDDSYPLYSEGSCPHIDEPFDCFHNGRSDRAYQKLRWQPDGCKVPRFNALDLLKRLRGKRLVFVGDSLNRNMWESLVCILKNSVKDKKKVFEASGRHEFRTEGSYSFLFKDYNCTVEFFRSPFLVQEWEMPDSNGKKKETLRLDIIERSSSRYKDANIIVFNTGHWWTHEKTAKGRDYYQEGNRVYSELNVVEAFNKALHTWARWVDANINPTKTLVLFRGYSASHFRGGQWNSGGACDRETEPIINDKFLSPYPPKMRVLEKVLNDMKTPVSYLNITRMTDFRKDAHPSIYRKQKLTEEERRAPERFQDCSHWCLPGVPDSWNELLYAQILIKQHQTPNW